MFISIASVLGAASIISEQMQIVNRTEWGAKPPKEVEYFDGPAPYVIIHHSYEPAACYTKESCIKAMQGMQRFHQVDRGWNDIGYTFGIGGDGDIYKGRGFNVVGAHAPRYNNKSVGICLIGDWSNKLPPTSMLDAAKRLIEYGLTEGHISPHYNLIGHRQVRDTLCPGELLFREISSWPHFMREPEETQENNIPA